VTFLDASYARTGTYLDARKAVVRISNAADLGTGQLPQGRRLPDRCIANNRSRLIADCGYDTDAYRHSLGDCGIPPRKYRKQHVAYVQTLHRRRHKVETMFES